MRRSRRAVLTMSTMTKQQGWILIGMVAVAIVAAFVIWKLNAPPEKPWTDDLRF